jgi:hypothetical protein
VSTGRSSSTKGGIVGGVLGGAFLIAIGITIIMVGKRMRQSDIAGGTQDTASIPPGGHIEEEGTAVATVNVPAVERYIDTDVGGHLQYSNQDFTGARLGDVV